MRALASLSLAAVLVSLAAAPADAHPVRPDDDRIWIVDERKPPPPPPPPTAPPPAKPRRPLTTALGFRMGATLAGPTSGFGLGLQGGLAFSTDLRGIAEYEYLILMSGDDDAAMAAPGTPRLADGSGHRARVGLRVNLGAASVAHTVRFYADTDATAGAALIDRPMTGRALVPEATLGLRLGYEMLADRERPSPSRWFDAHLLLRLVRTREDTGMMFGVGMEWGK